jgi:hypothetical protein
VKHNRAGDLAESEGEETSCIVLTAVLRTTITPPTARIVETSCGE